LAIDRESEAIAYTAEGLSPAEALRLRCLCSSFEELKELPPIDFAYAYHSLPFCAAGELGRVTSLLVQSVRPHGFFAGSFFGLKDEWVQSGRAYGLAEEGIRSFFTGFEILSFRERDRAGPTTLSGLKHWHVYESWSRASFPKFSRRLPSPSARPPGRPGGSAA
jgi:tellurite methyltransferase